MNAGSRVSKEAGLFKELNDVCFLIDGLVTKIWRTILLEHSSSYNS